MAFYNDELRLLKVYVSTIKFLIESLNLDWISYYIILKEVSLWEKASEPLEQGKQSKRHCPEFPKKTSDKLAMLLQRIC